MKLLMRVLLVNSILERKMIGETMIAGISFLLSVFTATYSDWFGIPGIVFKTVFCFIGILYCAKIVKDIVEMYRDKYNPPVSVRTSLTNLHYNEGLLIIPLCVYFNLFRLIQKLPPGE